MATQERTDYWQQQIANWQTSELSGQAFCKQQGIIYHQFVYWRQKLNPQPQPPQAGFARVMPATTDPVASELTLSLPNGLSITGIHEGNVSLLGMILKQL